MRKVKNLYEGNGRTNVTIVKDTIPLKEGYKIKIYHDEIKTIN